ncbi:tRNA (N6-threonylcarbamoyladenosine(37)-N6)-methyltransferase TrmO [Lachnospiraceae bacterium 62-26]
MRGRGWNVGLRREDDHLTLEVIAYIHTDFPAKFGIPRQSGLADTKAEIIFEPKYRNPDAVRGLEAFSHLWLIWGFSEAVKDEWSPTVRPPRLGGNTRVGVFASRSPFRPNPVGLSSVSLERMERREGKGIVLHVRGADLMDGTPIYDIKPYLPYVDCHAEASGGFAEQKKGYRLEVEIPGEWEAKIPMEHREILKQVLSQDPRPSYQQDRGRIYGMKYAGMEVRFQVEGNVLRVCEVEYELC